MPHTSSPLRPSRCASPRSSRCLCCCRQAACPHRPAYSCGPHHHHSPAGCHPASQCQGHAQLLPRQSPWAGAASSSSRCYGGCLLHHYHQGGVLTMQLTPPAPPAEAHWASCRLRYRSPSRPLPHLRSAPHSPTQAWHPAWRRWSLGSHRPQLSRPSSLRTPHRCSCPRSWKPFH